MPYDIIIGRDESDKERFGKKGLILLGKGYVKMGQYTSLSNPIYMDIARSHVVLIAGKRGSGKSYTIGVMAEELANLEDEAKKNIAPLIFDTMGIFWTMKYSNEKEKDLLESWDKKPKKMPVRIFVPYGYFDEYLDKKIPIDKKFALQASELTAEDWVITFNLSITNPIAILIERVINYLLEKEIVFGISQIKKRVEEDRNSDKEIKNAALALFEAAETWKIFAEKGEKGTQISDLISQGKTSILDLSMYSSIGGFNVRALVIGLITKKLFRERMFARKQEETEAVQRGIDYLTYTSEREMPLVWLFIDEAHEFLPKDEKTSATDPLIQVLREGRQPGISVVLATQQPGQIHRDVMTQSDIVLSHRVTSQPDVTALNEIMQSYLLTDIKQYLDDLPNLKGSAIILDDNSERIYPMRIRPRLTWHGGEAPTAIKVEKRI